MPVTVARPMDDELDFTFLSCNRLTWLASTERVAKVERDLGGQGTNSRGPDEGLGKGPGPRECGDCPPGPLSKMPTKATVVVDCVPTTPGYLLA